MYVTLLLHATFTFYSFLDRLPFSLSRSNGYRIEKSESAMFDRRRTVLQFYYKQRRRRYHRGRRYDRGLTHGNSKYLSYSTVKVCFASFCSKETFVRLCWLCILNIFSYIIRKIEVIPASRLQSIRGSELARSTEATRHTGPCGGFSTQYACMCDLHSVPYREEVAWVRLTASLEFALTMLNYLLQKSYLDRYEFQDVDTIYLSHDTRELNLTDFDHLDQKDLVPIISALEYNTWFTKLRASHLKLNHEPLERLLHVMRRSLSIQELYLDNLGIKW